MRFRISLAIALLCTQTAQAAVAFDAFTDSGLFDSTFSFTHTPVGTPRAVIVQIVDFGSGDGVTSVTYGGTSMTEVAGSPNTHTTGETAVAYTYFLGASIPTGAQTVTITSDALTKQAIAITLTANADTETVDVDATINSDSQANPSVTLSLGGRTSFATLGFGSGQDAVTGITPLTNWTARIETDAGSRTLGFYTYDTIGTADVTAGWTQTAEDAVAIAVAVSEIEGGAVAVVRMPLLGVGP